MFEIGFWELVLIALVALIVIGPERLPEVARTAGRWIARARSIVSNVRAEVEREFKVDELKRSLIHEETADQFRRLHDQIRGLETELRNVAQPPAAAETPPVAEPDARMPAPAPAEAPPVAPPAAPVTPAPVAAAAPAESSKQT